MKILKFKATWCAPCRVLSTMLDEFNECPIEDVNIDLEPDRASDHNVRGVPTLVLLDEDGTELWRKTGLITKYELENIVKNIKDGI